MFEIDLYPRIRTRALDTNNCAFAEFLMEHALTDAPR